MQSRLFLFVMNQLLSNAFALATRLNLARWIIAISALKIILGIVTRFTGIDVWDDALMFVRYADNFLAYGNVAWNPGGEAVYGTTSPLFLSVIILLRVAFGSNPLVILWFASIIGGLGFIVLFASLSERHTQLEPSSRDWVGALVFFSLAAPNTMLIQHLTTGMDTTLTLVYLTGFVWLYKYHERTQSNASALATGLIAGLAFFCRPELLIFTFILSAFVAIGDPTPRARRNAWLILAIAAGAVASEMLIAQLILNSPLPLPFYAKGLKLYGDAIYLQYAGKNWNELKNFLSAYWYLFALIAADLVLNFKPWRTGRAAEKGMLLAVVVFIAYLTFLVLQIMGGAARFYLPVLPIILWLGSQGLVALVQRVSRVPSARIRAGSWAIATFFALIALAFLFRRAYWEVQWLGARVPQPMFANFDAHRLVEIAWPRQLWYRLDEVADLPDDLVIAATEVGYLGALNPGKPIVDLAGLNTADFARAPFAANVLFEKYNPDLIYLPHPHYVEMNPAIFDAPQFRQNYVYRHRDELGVWLDVAIRRDSKHVDALRRILDKGKIASPVRTQ
jgi:hypothetical protein